MKSSELEENKEVRQVIYLSPKIKRSLKILCAQEGLKLKDLVIQAILSQYPSLKTGEFNSTKLPDITIKNERMVQTTIFLSKDLKKNLKYLSIETNISATKLIQIALIAEYKI